MEGFLRYEFGGLYLEVLIHGGPYFRNSTVYSTLRKQSEEPALKIELTELYRM